MASGLSGELENGQTRWIAGIADNRLLDERDLERAISNIERYFDWVGLTERFDECLIDVAVRFGWPNVLYTKKNVGNEVSSYSVEPRVRALIAERNSLDLRLYEHAYHHFEDRNAMYRRVRGAGATVLRVLNRVATGLRPAQG